MTNVMALTDIKATPTLSEQINQYIDRVATDLAWTLVSRPEMFKGHLGQIIQYGVKDIPNYEPLTPDLIALYGNRLLCVFQRASELIRDRLDTENVLNAGMEYHAVIVEEAERALKQIQEAVSEVNQIINEKGEHRE